MKNWFQKLNRNVMAHYRRDPRGFWVTLVIVAVIVLGLIYLREAPKPWEEGVVERLAEGKKPTEKHYVITYTWVAAAANLVLLGVLLGLKRFWLRPCAPLPADEQAHQESRLEPGLRRVFWVVVLAAVLIAGFQAWPRMSHSLWGDEEYTFRRNVHGDWSWTEQGDLVFGKIDWLKTAYGYRMPNNHLVQTILSRLAHDWWLANVWEPGEIEIDERVVRWPSFVFGLATIPILALLLARLGHPRAGPAAAVLLAVHPWFIRYISEMRGYAMMVFFVVLLLLLAVLALRTGRWRWWLAFGLCQFLMMWTNVLSLYVPMALNGAIVVLFILRWKEKAWLQGQVARWLVVNLLSVMLFFQVMLPNLPWLVDYVSNHQNTPRGTGPDWYADMAGYLLGGMDWGWRGADTPAYMNWTKTLSEFPLNLWAGAVLLLLVGCLAAGLWVSRSQRKRDPFMPMIALSLIGAPLLCIIHELLADEYFYFWYLIFALPLVPFFVGLGAEYLLDRAKLLRGPASGVLVPSVLLLVIAGGFFGVTVNRVQALYPIEPLRASAIYQRGGLEPYPRTEEDTGVITVGFMMFTPVYDPAGHLISSVDELRALMERARREGKTLYVAYGHAGYAEFAFPEIVELVQDPRFFEKEKVFHGTWPQLDRQVFRMKTNPTGLEQPHDS